MRQLSGNNCLAAILVSRYLDASPGPLGLVFRMEHNFLTPGHPAGRFPSPEGSPANKIYVYVLDIFETPTTVSPPKQLLETK